MHTCVGVYWAWQRVRRWAQSHTRNIVRFFSSQGLELMSVCSASLSTLSLLSEELLLGKNQKSPFDFSTVIPCNIALLTSFRETHCSQNFTAKLLGNLLSVKEQIKVEERLDSTRVGFVREGGPDLGASHLQVRGFLTSCSVPYTYRPFCSKHTRTHTPHGSFTKTWATAHTWPDSKPGGIAEISFFCVLNFLKSNTKLFPCSPINQGNLPMGKEGGVWRQESQFHTPLPPVLGQSQSFLPLNFPKLQIGLHITCPIPSKGSY